jgi:hypothetical protein
LSPNNLHSSKVTSENTWCDDIEEVAKEKLQILKMAGSHKNGHFYGRKPNVIGLWNGYRITELAFFFIDIWCTAC